MCCRFTMRKSETVPCHTPLHLPSHPRDDPTILAWSLANEPRGRGDTSGNRLDDWIKDTTNFIRSLDKKHLITVDTEGFFLEDDSSECLWEFENEDIGWTLQIVCR